MPTQPSRARINRRTFLRRFGAAAGVLAASHLIAACSNGAAETQTLISDRSAQVLAAHSSAARQDALRVGLLLPQPQIYSAAGANFRAGMDLFLGQHNDAQQPIALVAHEYGTAPGVAIEQARAWIAASQVDLIVGSLSSGLAATLHPLLHERQMPLLVSHIGANLTRNDGNSPYIIRNSLSYWQSSWALGRWAAATLGRQAFMASSFYDSGYDSLYAFQLGFENAGGTVVSTKITHTPTDTTELATLMAAIQAAQPDLVFAAYSGAQASDFVRVYAQAGLPAHIPLIGSAFLVDESLLPEQGTAALGIKTALPWAHALDLPANQAFTSAFQSFSGRRADAFAVLGYDTAQLISAAVTVSGAAQLRQALSAAAFNSPRGAVQMDQTLLDVDTPLYLREVRAGAGRASNVVIDKLPAVPMFDAQIQALRASTKTGWSNAYLYI